MAFDTNNRTIYRNSPWSEDRVRAFHSKTACTVDLLRSYKDCIKTKHDAMDTSVRPASHREGHNHKMFHHIDDTLKPTKTTENKERLNISPAS